ncbi:AzlC family ABC transporter permease [Aquamicrobium defluvii]|uniref:Branched-chain amino acid ABC transporter permease n=2 Tax=Aquamicrobium defluvii TaxID=69279 RepID=A0A011VN02_9HYPH|nr:AzlC family ABC transporter permease [Aquamicrobium defluvii]EXL09760.1 branched-chain amino acid ABC transporter permease [Aquamicrobium defluvii]EZQ16541.1 branched-chain amino acid ABC transporter permease [Halopseudomonas bauzanensis]TDR37969.1 putative branched-subunit amino acid permease [Aquamicrobium defluvii]
MAGQAADSRSSTSKSSMSEFWHGARFGLPVCIAVSPFGLLFGTLAVENGLSVLEAVFMSAFVFGGASQMVGIELFGQKVAPWMIALSIFAVNFRHVLYSAAIGRYLAGWPLARQAFAFFLLTDAQYALAESQIQSGRKLTFARYMGAAVTSYLTWVATTVIGAIFGKLIPDTSAIGVDFLLPIYFLGLVMDFRKRPLWLPVVAVSAVASILAYRFVGSPWHVLLGALAGVALAVILPPSRSGIGAAPAQAVENRA